MASFYAELEVGGHTYPLRQCRFEFTQATDGRGRVVEKVRHGLVHLTLDVPEDCFLEAWAAAPYKPLAGHITFFETNQRSACETLGFEVGHCVGYHEEFLSGDLLTGAYVCQVTIASPRLTLNIGGPSRRYVAPAPRDYAYVPPARLLAPDPLTPPPLTKRQRYEVRMQLLADSQAKLDRETQRRLADLHPPTAALADATRVAPSGRAEAALRAAGPGSRPEDLTPLQAANDRLARNNFAVERAKLSDDSYFNDLKKLPNGTYAAVRAPMKDAVGKVMLDAAGKPIPMDTPEGWVVKKIFKGKESGFMAVLYQSTFTTPPQNVLAFRGTDADPAAMAESKRDAITDMKQGVGIYTDAFKQTETTALKVQKSLQGEPFDICGHSLGGAQASLAGLLTGRDTYTFNSAGLHVMSMARAGIKPDQLKANMPKIQAYFADNDPLNWNQDNPGIVKGAAKAGVKALTWPLGPLTAPVAPIIDSPLVMPQAIGTRHLLDSQTHDRLPGLDVAGHSIPPMVDAIERQKDEDTARLRQFTDQP